MARNNRITLYDLQLASGCTISPFVWRTKYALAHKGFEVDLVPAALPASSSGPAGAPSECR
jgi:hypothetical protein